MNWVIKFNQLEKENMDKTIDIIANFDNYKNDLLDDVYTKAYNLNYSIDNLINKLNANAILGEELRIELEMLIKTYIEIKEEDERKMKDILEYILVCGKEVIRLADTMSKITNRFISCKKDFYLHEKRKEAFSRKLMKIYTSLQMDPMYEENILIEVHENLMSIKKIIEAKNNELDEEEKLIEQLKQNKKEDYLKIFDYKEMIDLAEKNEYKQIRQSGDHIIMQHKISNKIVPIPAHELKYGLMLQIQKQIESNKVG